MADTMRFDLVSPERRLASAAVSTLRIPGADGDLTVGPGHAPLVTTLRPGILRAEGPEGAQEYAVTGGFAEVGAEGATVLAERALPTGELTQEVFDRYFAEAEGNLRRLREGAGAQGGAAGDARAPDGAADEAAKLLADMVAMGTHIGLSPRQPNL